MKVYTKYYIVLIIYIMKKIIKLIYYTCMYAIP